ncbi:hypothetical protein QTL97_06045 [Sporosarcina thermotolerans]|uniref:Uncharacterized protein n=1 Tax=Sporosarcina thermotolerans TaxID=633404 RepID=A0AAW9A5J2_9BACL|nr:hypothetical protein [Sporosarcina thermotolerans]MDW0116487.1 hypothetical protein [Sporosarcina thermotolerans]WHT48719.1 hypothetical protein QNH10_02855 [Sporosarcina thermotolerans]
MAKRCAYTVFGLMVPIMIQLKELTFNKTTDEDEIVVSCWTEEKTDARPFKEN